jgi:hypothetical protein
MFRNLRVFAILFVLLHVAACTKENTTIISSGPDEFPTRAATALSDVVGLWLVENGSMMSDFVAGLATFGVTADVTAIQINNDGTGHVWLRDRLTGTKDCVRAFVIFDDTDGTLVFDFAAEPTSDVVFNTAIDDYTYIYPVVTVDSGFLGLADAEGTTALLSSQVALPADVDCATLSVTATYAVPAPQFFSDIAHYGDELIWAGGTSQIEAFDLGTLMMGTPLGPTSSRLVQTAQGVYFWTHCGCGGSRDAFRRNLTTVFDTVESETEMGGAITFRAMAYNPMTDRLWLHGREFDDQFGRFYVMNTNGEPDVIDQTFSFNRDIRGLAFDGTDLWAIVTVATQSVVKIDPTNSEVLESYEVPDVDVSWSGLEMVSGIMYMLGTDLDGNGVLVQIDPSIPSSILANAPATEQER